MIQHPTPRRSVLLGLAGACGFSGLAAAAPDPAAVAPIQELYAKLLEVMKAGQSTPFARRFDMLAPVIDKVFDLPTILQNSVGPSWSSLAPADQEALSAAFRRYTIASYVNSFDSYSGQRFDVQPTPRESRPGEQIVQSKIIPRSGDSHELDYVMRQRSPAWRVVDVLAEGSISRVAVQRSDFRHILTSGGAPALIKTLQQKSADIGGGSH